MAMPLTITMIHDQPPEVSARKTKEWQRHAFGVIGEYWFQHYLPDHFATYAAAKYGYQARTRRYLQRKAALAKAGVAKEGGLVDLILTGDMRDVMIRASQIRAFPTRATVVMQAPLYMTFRPRGNQPDKQAEVLSVIDSQRRKFDALWGGDYESQLAQFKAPRRTSTTG